MFDKILKNRVLTTILVSLGIFLLIILLQERDFIKLINKRIQNVYFSLSEGRVSKEIIVVEIDNKTLKKLTYPLDRKEYAPVLKNLKEAGAAVVGLDIIFADRGLIPESDKIFAQAIGDAGNVVGGVSMLKNDTPELPLEMFNDKFLSKGFLSPNIDLISGVVYSIRPIYKFINGDIYNHFSITIFKSYLSHIYNDDKYNDVIRVSRKDFFGIDNNYNIPYASKGSKSVLIRFADRSKFKKASFIDIHDSEQFDLIKRDYEFKDKIVLIGTTANGIKDVFNVYSGNEYGVYVHANMINTMLTKSYLEYFDKNIEKFLIFLVIITSVYFNFSRSGFVLIFSNIAIISIFLVIYPVTIAVFTNYIMNLSFELLIALVISLTISNILKYVIENKYKNKLNKALSEYVSKDIAAEIMLGHGKVNLNGENKNISIFFSDIEGFTTISEKFAPEELVAFLRMYLGEMSNIIMDEKGFINKYEGDAIMALWGVFGTSDNDAYYACKTALLQQSKLDYLNHIWEKKGFDEIRARIGIHTGPAIIGNIGSEGRKMEFTALGDSVNLASRLERVNKFYGTYICVSEDVYEKVKDEFEFRYLDEIRVKGKNTSVVIYELLALKDQLLENKRKIVEEYLEAIKLYKQREFESAKAAFTKLAEKNDAPSKTYKKRCETYIQNPPELDWDGVTSMESK